MITDQQRSELKRRIFETLETHRELFGILPKEGITLAALSSGILKCAKSERALCEWIDKEL